MIQKPLWAIQLQLPIFFFTENIISKFNYGELEKSATVKESLTVQNEGGRKVKWK
jgi:hypothetical protein